MQKVVAAFAGTYAKHMTKEQLVAARVEFNDVAARNGWDHWFRL